MSRFRGLLKMHEGSACHCGIVAAEGETSKTGSAAVVATGIPLSRRACTRVQVLSAFTTDYPAGYVCSPVNKRYAAKHGYGNPCCLHGHRRESSARTLTMASSQPASQLDRVRHSVGP